MSVRVIDAVFRLSRSRGSARLVLLALADVASDAGEVTAYKRSQTILAAKANIDPKTVPRAVDTLIELGELVLLDEDGNEHTSREDAAGGGRRRTDYRIKLAEPPADGGDRSTRGHPPQDAGAPPADDGGQPPQDAGSITPSLLDPDPSSSVEKAPKRRAKKVALPVDFTVSDDMRAWAADNAPTVDVDAQTQRFVDHWTSKGERRIDWVATWRNWIRNAADWGGRTRAQRPAPPGRPTEPRLPIGSEQGGRISL